VCEERSVAEETRGERREEETTPARSLYQRKALELVWGRGFDRSLARSLYQRLAP